MLNTPDINVTGSCQQAVQEELEGKIEQTSLIEFEPNGLWIKVHLQRTSKLSAQEVNMYCQFRIYHLNCVFMMDNIDFCSREQSDISFENDCKIIILFTPKHRMN